MASGIFWFDLHLCRFPVSNAFTAEHGEEKKGKKAEESLGFLQIS